MEQLQNIDLILSIVIKVIFLLLGIILVLIFYKINKTLKYIRDKSDQITISIQNTSSHIKDELTVDKFFNKFRTVIESTVKVYLLDNVRKNLLSKFKKFL